MPLKSLQITITATNVAQQFQSGSLPVRQIYMQNNGSNIMTVGDSAITTSRGILLLNGVSRTSPGDANNAGAFTGGATDLNEWYVLGTQGDTLDVLYII